MPKLEESRNSSAIKAQRQYPKPEHFEFDFALVGARVYDFLHFVDDAPEGQTNASSAFKRGFGD